MRVSSTLFFLASLAVSGLASTAADVKADIVTITTQLNALNTAINAFTLPGGTLAQALVCYALYVITFLGINTSINIGHSY
jgi:hypothetical protein